MNYNCPNQDCLFYKTSTLIVKDGSYRRGDDSRRIQRYRCKNCNKRFSPETFKLEYRQKKRRVNYKLMELLSSGVSMRRSALLLRISRKTVARKLIYLGEKSRMKQSQFLKSFEKKKISKIQFDDLITKENSKLKPLSVTVAVDEKNRYILDSQVSVIAAFGHLSEISKKKYGPRKSTHKEGLKRLFDNLRPIVSQVGSIKSDEHTLYPEYVRNYFPKAKYKAFKGDKAHVAGQGEMKKNKNDPLFAINHALAMLRANINRLIRKTWCTSKKIERLKDHLDIFTYYFNKIYLKNFSKPAAL